MSNKREYTEMTADAKVGLLLGLVFIAIIAFVINGLPDFVQSSREKPMVETAVTTQTGGNLVIEPAVVDVARSLQEKRTTMRYVDPPVDTTVLDQYAGGLSVTPNKIDAESGVAKTQEPAPNETALQPEKIVETAQKTVNSTEMLKPDSVVAFKTQEKLVPAVSHKVEEGENLSGIAKKYYGEQEGNKLSTIQMLYEANKTILESPDAIRAGDELVIPKIKTAAVSDQAAQPKKEPVSSMLDKFKNVFSSVEKKPETAAKTAPADDKKTTVRPQASVADKTTLLKTDKVPPVKNDSQTPVTDKTTLLKTDKAQPVKIDNPQPLGKGVTDYTVQSGDYLYKIAQKQLGDGNRYPEILKLNSGLSETERLKVGMKLKVPKK